ncbi:hypothetical protein BOX15_Mlig006180g2 [Macrostomum lignano]|nr:hypothetical protein BOX15_Mlig006180g2 [Macrostomum lignano]
MKVSLAAQVFSHSVASGMRVLVDHDRMEKSALQTAEFVEKVNEMFDILNSASLFGKHGKGAVTEESAETVLSQLSAAQEFILTWRFSPVRGGRSKTTMPFKEGWLLSIESAKRIIHFGLREAGVSYLCLRRFSQDHVENFFSMVRGRNGFNEKPELHAFLGALRSISAGKMERKLANGTNCEDDGDAMAVEIRDLREKVTAASTSAAEQPQQHRAVSADGDVATEIAFDNVEATEVVPYIGGWIFRKLQIFACNSCKDELVTDESPARTFTHKNFEDSRYGLT